MNDRFELNDGNHIPKIGFGVYQAHPSETYDACMSAIKVGYRHIDTAALYGNEAEVGKSVRDCGIPRSELFITTKLWNTAQGYEEALAACEQSLKKLNIGYIDLYLLHSPVEGKRLDSWRALEKLKSDGKVKSIGVSNFNVHHLKEIMNETMGFKYKPAVNQIELHPYLYESREEVIEFCKHNGILIEAYSPLTRGKKLSDRKLVALAKQYGKTPAQMLLRWCLEKNFVTLPKSVHIERIKENFDIHSWSIKKEDVETMDGWDEGLTVAWNPLEWD
jgi:methylglyoxal/glyoxal reductase